MFFRFFIKALLYICHKFYIVVLMELIKRKFILTFTSKE